MKEKKDQSKYKPSESQETLNEWIRPRFEKLDIKEAKNSFTPGGSDWGYYLS